MAFQLRINGQQVWTSERQVTRISMQSGRGEIGAAGISPQDGVIDIFVEEVSPGGPLRLDEVERARDESIRATDEGTEVGSPAYAPPTDANKPHQGVPSRDVPAGGPDIGEKPDFVQNRPETSPTGSTLNPDGSVAVGVNETGLEGPTSTTTSPTDEETLAGEQTQTAPQTSPENQNPAPNFGGFVPPGGNQNPQGQNPSPNQPTP